MGAVGAKLAGSLGWFVKQLRNMSEELFKSIGLDAKTSANTVKNPALTATLAKIIDFVGIT